MHPASCWQDKDSGVQKKSYKVVAYLCESRPGFIRANLQVCATNLEVQSVTDGSWTCGCPIQCNDDQLDCP
jgi:hypothetical protein